MKISAISIIQTLRSAGYQAYFAGGCVRDLLLGKAPQDYDIVTSAKPDEIERIFANTKPVGKAFGVILVKHQGHLFEIASFRSDAGYSDGRRPDAIVFSDAASDALRRDFTINGLFYDPLAEVVLDYVEGQKDLAYRLIRFIGNPSHRVREDHLRLLRAVRFRNLLDFQYHPETYQALKQLGPELAHRVSAERLAAELNKMISDPTNPGSSFRDLSDLGILPNILPELEQLKGCPQPAMYHQEGDVWTHTIAALNALPAEADLVVRWATLLHDIGKPDTISFQERIRFDSHASISAQKAQKILSRLNFPSKLISAICWCISHHMMMVQLLEMSPGRRLQWFLHENFPQLLAVMHADASGTTPSDLSLFQKIKDQYRLETSKIKRLPKSLLNGHQIMELTNLPASPKLTEIKNQLLELQLEGKINTISEAKTWLQNNFPKAT